MNYKVTGEQLTSIADAIREKTGSSEQIVFPDGFVDNVATLTKTTDATATPSDIKFGKTAYANGLKITGTYVPLDTSDATATATDIKHGKTAYVGGSKLNGNAVTFDEISKTTGTINATCSFTGKISINKNASFYMTAECTLPSNAIICSNDLATEKIISAGTAQPSFTPPSGFSILKKGYSVQGRTVSCVVELRNGTSSSGKIGTDGTNTITVPITYCIPQ